MNIAKAKMMTGQQYWLECSACGASTPHYGERDMTYRKMFNLWTIENGKRFCPKCNQEITI